MIQEIQKHRLGIAIGSTGWAALVLYLIYEYAKEGSIAGLLAHISNTTPLVMIFHAMIFSAPILSMLFGYMTERRTVLQQELQETKEFLDSTIDCSADAIITTDAEGIITSWSRSAEALFGYSAEKILGKPVDVLYPEELKGERKKWQKSITEGKTLRNLSTKIYNSKGDFVDISLSLAPLKDDGGKVIGAVGVSKDVTERRKAEDQIKADLKEKEVLLREIHHRVKNNMQVISSLLGLQSRYIKDKGGIEVFKETRNRIKSMALVHEKLYQSKDLANIDFNDYIENLANGLFRAYGANTGKIALTTDVEGISLGVDAAIPCGLIINELISNSLKHAFPEDKEGEIKIVLRLNDEDEIELAVSDDGVGMPEDLDFRNTESLGLHLVTILAEDQLQGKIKLDRSNGTKFQIRFRRGE